MRRTLATTLALTGLAAGLIAFAPSRAGALADPAKEARLLTASGKFAEAKAALEAAPEEVRNDPKLLKTLGDFALKWAKRKDGPEKVPGLIAAKDFFAAAVRVTPADVDAASGAVETCLDLVEIQIESKQPTLALDHADWAVQVGEAALKGGADTPELRLGVAAAHDQRAKLSHKIQDFDRIVLDYDRSAELSVSCVETARKPADALSAAARVYLDLAAFIAEGRPIPEEVRDEEALVKAIEIAKQACETKGADKEQFTVHLLALRDIHRAKREGAKFDEELDFGKPYMQELGKREGIDGLDIHVPKADGWNRIAKSGDWDLFFERKLEGDDTAMQIMIRVYGFSETMGGKPYDQVEKIAKLRYDVQTKDDFSEVVSSTEPEQIQVGKKKKGPELWHHEIAGTMNKRRVKVGEWMLMPSKKGKKTYRLRIIDWRSQTDLLEPDVVAFVNQALGLVEADDGKKKKGRR